MSKNIYNDYKKAKIKSNELSNEYYEQIREIEPLRKKMNAAGEDLERIKEEIKSIELAKIPEIVALAEDYDVRYFYIDMDNEDDYRNALEYDGSLHISVGKIRFSFIWDEDLSMNDWKQEAAPILKAFWYTQKDLWF